jgi:hypothetical protein
MLPNSPLTIYQKNKKIKENTSHLEKIIKKEINPVHCNEPHSKPEQVRSSDPTPLKSQAPGAASFTLLCKYPPYWLA